MIETIKANEVYSRIISNKPYGKNFKPYTKKVINYVISEFIKSEEYEKCSILTEFINNRFDHTKNYTTFM